MDTLELARKHLTPYLKLLYQSINEAWIEYHKTFSKDVHKLSSLAPSVIMNGLVVSYAKKHFDGLNTVEIKKNSHSAIFTIRSPIDNFRVDLRFKKLDKYYRTQNAKSARNSNFVNQVYEPYLGDELKPLSQTRININAGFQIGEAWDSIETWITCPNGAKSIAWKFPMIDEDAGASTVQEKQTAPPLPLPSGKRTEATEIITEPKKKGIK